MGKNLNHNSNIVETVANSPNELTPIFTVDPEDGTYVTIENEVSQGDAAGIAIYAKLFDADGDPLPTDTTMVLSGRRPGDTRYQTLSYEQDNISTYNNKSISDQQDSNHVDSVKHELKAERVNIRDVDEFAVEINSDVAIDWGESKLYFERTGVSEHQR